MEGFWTAHFSTPAGAGAGVAYLRDGQIYGGDGGYTYRGSYTFENGRLLATLNVSPFVAGTPSVFGSIGRAFQITITADVVGGEASGTGKSDVFPKVIFGVRLKRVD